MPPWIASGRLTTPAASNSSFDTRYLFEVNTRWTIDGSNRRNRARYNVTETQERENEKGRLSGGPSHDTGEETQPSAQAQGLAPVPTQQRRIMKIVHEIVPHTDRFTPSLASVVAREYR
jgi:hypothetical protein